MSEQERLRTLPNQAIHNWACVDMGKTSPRHNNSKESGVYVCIIADLISLGRPIMSIYTMSTQEQRNIISQKLYWWFFENKNSSDVLTTQQMIVDPEFIPNEMFLEKMLCPVSPLPPDSVDSRLTEKWIDPDPELPRPIDPMLDELANQEISFNRDTLFSHSPRKATKKIRRGKRRSSYRLKVFF